jgi:hypothetical protein
MGERAAISLVNNGRGAIRGDTLFPDDYFRHNILPSIHNDLKRRYNEGNIFYIGKRVSNTDDDKFQNHKRIDGLPMFLIVPRDTIDILFDIEGEFHIKDYSIYDPTKNPNNLPQITRVGAGDNLFSIVPEWDIVYFDTNGDKKNQSEGETGKKIDDIIHINEKPSVVRGRINFFSAIALDKNSPYHMNIAVQVGIEEKIRNVLYKSLMKNSHN